MPAPEQRVGNAPSGAGGVAAGLCRAGVDVRALYVTSLPSKRDALQQSSCT